MTLIRGLALKISEAAVRWASPGCKEWAAGLAREVEFIESDWRALGWSLGSTRLLLSPRELPVQSLADVPAAADKFLRDKRLKSSLAYYVCIASGLWMVITLCLDWHLVSSPLGLIGNLLVPGAVFFLGLRAYCRREWTAPSEPRECALFYRSELLAYVDFQSGRTSTLCLVALVCGIILMWLGLQGTSSFKAEQIALSLAMFIIPVMQAYANARKYRHLVGELDVLLAEKG